MSHTFAGRSASSTGGPLEKGRIDVTRVKRYWKGRAPEWVEQEEEPPEQEQRREAAAPVIIAKTADPRLERLSLSEIHKQTVTPAHRRIHSVAPSTVHRPGVTVPEVKEDEDEDTVLRRRAQLRLKLLETRKDEQAVLADAEDEEETSSDEYESDSDDAIGEGVDNSRRLLMKPVFVSSGMRETVQERQRLEEEEEREWEAQKQKLQQRMQDTKEIVSQKIKAEAEAEQNKDEIPKEAADIITDDDADEEDTEFESWKQREMSRIKRDKEEVLVSEKYAEEREKLKNMTEEERMIYDRLNPKMEAQKAKKKWKFLQKYWHKGAFYQEEPDDIRGTAGTDVNVFGRDFSDPTGEDKMDRKLLPEVMQVKNFGRSGRTKWTHLVNEDTTNFDDPWANKDAMRMKYNRRMAASEQEFQKPKRFKS